MLPCQRRSRPVIRIVMLRAHSPAILLRRRAIFDCRLSYGIARQHQPLAFAMLDLSASYNGTFDEVLANEHLIELFALALATTTLLCDTN